MSEPHLVFHPAVGEDLESILAYYAERDPALPSRFRARLKEQADRLLMFPESGTILFESYRRVLLKRFPYMVVCLVSEQRIHVLAWVSVRRDPVWIEETVAGRTGELWPRSSPHIVRKKSSRDRPRPTTPSGPAARVCAGQTALSGMIKR